MANSIGNIFETIPGKLPNELIEILAEGKGECRIERIVSRGHSSPEGFWYDQETTEWVVLLRGEAELRFADDDRVLSMTPGDWITIPAHCRHRVESTSVDEDTIWLAVHWTQ